jgi:hypothetical protein
VTTTTTRSTGIQCINCREVVRHPDDRYHLYIPDGWTLDDVRAWAAEGATVDWLRRRGVRVWKRCVACQTREEPTT